MWFRRLLLKKCVMYVLGQNFLWFVSLILLMSKLIPFIINKLQQILKKDEKHITVLVSSSANIDVLISVQFVLCHFVPLASNSVLLDNVILVSLNYTDSIACMYITFLVAATCVRELRAAVYEYEFNQIKLNRIKLAMKYWQINFVAYKIIMSINLCYDWNQFIQINCTNDWNRIYYWSNLQQPWNKS